MPPAGAVVAEGDVCEIEIVAKRKAGDGARIRRGSIELLPVSPDAKVT